MLLRSGLCESQAQAGPVHLEQYMQGQYMQGLLSWQQTWAASARLILAQCSHVCMLPSHDLLKLAQAAARTCQQQCSPRRSQRTW